MSTTFKIIENHIESSKISPKKSSVMTSSQHLSPGSRLVESISDSDSIDQEEVLRLEIKQLQRENKFLKKKIADLTAELNGEHHPKKKTPKGKGSPKDQSDPVELTVDFFFKEINNLMNSVSDLFKVQFSGQELKQFASRFPAVEQSTAPNKKYAVYKKFVLARKLQKITLETEDRRYSLLLDVFSTYYKAKEDCDRFIRSTIDDLSTRAMELNKMILSHATRRKSSMKGSCIKSTYTVDDNNNEYLLTMPWSVKGVSPPSNFGLVLEQVKRKLDPEIQPAPTQ